MLARLLMDAPNQVREAHLGFLRAEAHDRDVGKLSGLVRRVRAGPSAATTRRGPADTAQLRSSAGSAPDGRGRAGAVGGCLGRAVWAVPTDGSEYRGRYGLSVRELAAMHSLSRRGATTIHRKWLIATKITQFRSSVHFSAQLCVRAV